MQTARLFFRKHIWLVAILMVGCKADLTTKGWAAMRLKDAQAIEVVPNWFELRYVENNAIAFSFLRDIPEHIRLPLIFCLSLLASFVLIGLLWHWRQRQFMDLLPLVLILSGALGNIIDRLINGYVIDFLYVHYQYEYNFPIFNIADMLICCGVVLLFYQHWNTRETPEPRESEA
jgi:signal peptidase II